jgi:hypothetical protein
LMSTTIAAADDGVGHVSGCPWLPEFAAQLSALLSAGQD